MSLASLHNPARHSDSHDGPGAPRPSSTASPDQNHHPESDDPSRDHPDSSPPPSSLPEHFDEEARIAFLFDYFNPDLDHFQVAANAGLRLSQYYAYITSAEFRQRLAEQTAISEERAKACAKLAQSQAIASLQHIVASYNEAVRDEPPPKEIKAMALRQRQSESARRAAGLILKVGGALPASLRPPRRAEPADPALHKHAPPDAHHSPLLANATRPAEFREEPLPTTADLALPAGTSSNQNEQPGSPSAPAAPSDTRTTADALDETGYIHVKVPFRDREHQALARRADENSPDERNPDERNPDSGDADVTISLESSNPSDPDPPPAPPLSSQPNPIQPAGP